MIAFYTSFALKFFFLFTPFFALSMFLAMTANRSERERRALACRVAVATIVIACVLFFFGQVIFDIFGVTIDAFRIGAGILLLLTAISLMNAKNIAEEGEDISVVPLAMPVIVGPASCGALMVVGAGIQTMTEKMVALASLFTALIAVWIILMLGSWIEKRMGKRGISIMMRLTALILSALAAQMIMSGVVSFLKA